GGGCIASATWCIPLALPFLEAHLKACSHPWPHLARIFGEIGRPQHSISNNWMLQIICVGHHSLRKALKRRRCHHAVACT
ncbi:hypothetical protein DFH09DRAFT_1158300, partial [Mycena vulgaris]